MADRFIFDTSAFITFLQGEAGAPRVLELLEKAARREVEVFACFVSLTEVQYITFHDFGDEAARKAIADLKRLAITWQHSDDALCASAAKIKAEHQISFADAFVAAAALRADATHIHKDPEFAPLSSVLKQEMLSGGASGRHLVRLDQRVKRAKTSGALAQLQAGESFPELPIVAHLNDGWSRAVISSTLNSQPKSINHPFTASRRGGGRRCPMAM